MSEPAPPWEHNSAPAPERASDIPRGNWIDRYAPGPARPYLRLARLDRPIGTWLLLLPGWWAIVLAATAESGGWPDGWALALFGIGAIVMRGAGCVINDITDRDYDARVARTRDRPIPSGAVSVTQALVFLAALLATGLIILLQFNAAAVAVGALSLALVFPYPLMKRITHWPQAFLGLTFNWGALLGWVAIRGSLDPPALALYAAGFFWTLGYDTIYAHQDKEDDALVGVKSTALLLGDRSRPWIAGFYGVAIVLLLLTGYLAGLAWPFYPVLALAAGHLAWQSLKVRFDDPADCLARFKANRDFGLIVLAGVLAGQAL